MATCKVLREAILAGLLSLSFVTADAEAQSQYQYNHPLKPLVFSQSNANVMVASKPTDGPMRDGAWLVSGAGIRDVFENATEDKVPTIRHKSSGLICQNPRVVFAPKQSDPYKFDPANLSGCIERLNGFQVDVAVAPNGQLTDIQSALSAMTSQIEASDKGFSKSVGGKNSTASDMQKWPYAWMQLTSPTADEPRLMQLSIASAGDWIFLTKTRCWSDQTLLCRQIGDLALQQAILSAGAERMLMPVAERGDVRAQYALGELYADPGAKQDVAKAVTWFRKAADQGYGPAQAMLGGMYAMGGGVPPDPTQAAAWFRKAADQGDVTGEAGLATCYARGLGVPQDDEKAFIWFKRAAEQRFLPAQINVGLMYQSGRGVARDLVQALMWFDLATGHLLPDSVQGAAVALKARDNLSAQMTPDQVEEAKRRAVAWRAAQTMKSSD